MPIMGEGYIDSHEGVGKSLVLSLWTSLARCVCHGSVVCNITLDFPQFHDCGSLCWGTSKKLAQTIRYRVDMAARADA
jgi:hypothetical protein